MELSILCDCEISVTIRRRDEGDLNVYASDPYDEIIKNYQNYTGDYTLFTNEHIEELVPGKISSRDAGYSVTKEAPALPIWVPSTMPNLMTSPSFAHLYEMSSNLPPQVSSASDHAYAGESNLKRPLTIEKEDQDLILKFNLNEP
eukprot:331770_1